MDRLLVSAEAFRTAIRCLQKRTTPSPGFIVSLSRRRVNMPAWDWAADRLPANVTHRALDRESVAAAFHAFGGSVGG